MKRGLLGGKSNTDIIVKLKDKILKRILMLMGEEGTVWTPVA